MRKIQIMGVLLAGILVLLGACSSPASTPTPTHTLTPTPVLVPQSSNLVKGTITVKAGGWYHVSFSVTSAMIGPRVVGSFKASGGSGNDIVALILDDMAYTNWSNGHTVNALYTSGQITVANINVPISTPGTYHLVFSNIFSIFISKDVATKVDLQWSEMQYR